MQKPKGDNFVKEVRSSPEAVELFRTDTEIFCYANAVSSFNIRMASIPKVGNYQKHNASFNSRSVRIYNL